ncbi:MAG: hypothetical protein Q9167_004220 [Letrouitia subvulpina]
MPYRCVNTVAGFANLPLEVVVMISSNNGDAGHLLVEMLENPWAAFIATGLYISSTGLPLSKDQIPPTVVDQLCVALREWGLIQDNIPDRNAVKSALEGPIIAALLHYLPNLERLKISGPISGHGTIVKTLNSESAECLHKLTHVSIDSRNAGPEGWYDLLLAFVRLPFLRTLSAMHIHSKRSSWRYPDDDDDDLFKPAS